MKSLERTRRATAFALLILPVLLLGGGTAASAAAPIARDDHAVATDRYLETVNGVETYSILIDVLANDEDADGDPLEVVIQGDFGLPPAIWVPDPVGSVQYLGAGLFDLTFGKEELGDATEVTFQYELEGAASPATVRVNVAGEGPAPELTARDDEFDDRWACWLTLPVLANDTGLDVIQSFEQPSSGEVRRDDVDPQVLVYRGGAGGTFTYTAASSSSGETATATVSVNQGNVIGPKSTSTEFGTIEMADCFDRNDDMALDGQAVDYLNVDGTLLDPPTWSAFDLTHRDQTATQASAWQEGSSTRRKGYLPFDPEAPASGTSATAFQIQGTFLASPDSAEWVALAFTEGNGSVLNKNVLSVWLDIDTGGLTLYGRRGGGLEELLGTASPSIENYTFLRGGINHLRLRLDTAPATPRVDVWINGTRALSEPFVDEAGQPVAGSVLTGAIENVGFFVHYGLNASQPGDVWFDDFELRLGDVSEARLYPKAEDPAAGADVESGSTVSLGPLHVGCTADHSDCHPSQETSVWLTNDGNDDLQVDHLSFEGPTEWTLVTPSLTSFSIPPGGQEEIRVRAEALEVGATSSRLELTTSDDDLPKLVVHFAAEVTEAPLADFVHYCSGLQCSFDGGASTGVNLAQSVYNYAWFLNDQLQTYGPTLDRSFSTSGVHTVALRVTDATGAQHRLERTVSVAPEAAFTFTCSTATRTCDFDAAATTEGVSSFRYELGDGAVQTGTGDPGAVLVRHTYATSGRYDVTLVVDDEDGQEDSVTHEVVLPPVPDFTASCSAETLTCDLDATISTPLLTHYEWHLGDGTRAVGAQIDHVYATSGVYSVTLTVVDRAGQIEAVSKLVTIPPRAELSVTCDQDLFTCSFDGTASTPGVSHTWDFGDGSAPATGPVQEHLYGTSGIFTATLTVTDASGQTASSSREVVLSPQAAFTVACDSLRCRFDASDSSPGVTSYSWDFGHDSATATGVAPTHDFPDAGEYPVSLTVTDGSGQTATTTETLTVFDEELFLLILLDRH